MMPNAVHVDVPKVAKPTKKTVVVADRLKRDAGIASVMAWLPLPVQHRIGDRAG